MVDKSEQQIFKDGEDVEELLVPDEKVVEATGAPQPEQEEDSSEKDTQTITNSSDDDDDVISPSQIVRTRLRETTEEEVERRKSDFDYRKDMEGKLKWFVEEALEQYGTLPSPHCDMILVYAKEDRAIADNVLRDLRDCPLRGFTAYLYDDESAFANLRLASVNEGDYVSKIIKKASLVLFLTTKAGSEGLWPRVEDIFTSRMIQGRRDVIPVYVKPRHKCDFRVPRGLDFIKGLQYYDDLSYFKRCIENLATEHQQTKFKKARLQLNQLGDYKLREIFPLNERLEDFDAPKSQMEPKHVVTTTCLSFDALDREKETEAKKAKEDDDGGDDGNNNKE